MIRKIMIEDLKPGMFIIDLTQSWSRLLSLNKTMFVADKKLVQLIEQSGFNEIFIDTSKTKKITKAADINLADQKENNVLKEEFTKAIAIRAETHLVISSIMADIQIGKKIKLHGVNDIVEEIVTSIKKNSHALVGLTMLQQKNKYLSDRAVSSCVIMVLFAKNYGLDLEEQLELGIAALLHDIGMVNVPSQILNKPGKLLPAEQREMQKHVSYGLNILKTISPGIPKSALVIAGQHHERNDGSGYPGGLLKKNISLYGQMAAIVDVYDASTSDKGYQKGASPTTALGDILLKSNNEFDEELVNCFIQAIGIFPFGTILRLENGMIGIVIDPKSDDLLYPTLRIVFDLHHGGLIKPYELDLQKHKNDDYYKIKSAEIKEKLFLSEKEIVNILVA